MGKASNPQPPDAQDVARRLVILQFVAASVLSSPPRDFIWAQIGSLDKSALKKLTREAEAKGDEFWKPLHHAKLWRFLTGPEQKLAKQNFVTLTFMDQIKFSWRVECVLVLRWALGMVPELPAFDVQAEHEILERPPGTSLANFLGEARLRPREEIETARHAAELWHWRSRTRYLIESGPPLKPSPELSAQGISSYDDIVRIAAARASEQGDLESYIDGDFGVSGKAYRDLEEDEWSIVQSITVERHYALNWLCGYAPFNDWERTPTET